MTNALIPTNGAANMTAYSPDWARQQEKLDLLKRTVAEGTSNDEFALFVEVARSSGLNPFQRQIYAIMRSTYNPETKRKEPRMTIQTGIDGYRLIAARTGVHAGTSDPEYGPVVNGYPSWARVTVKKLLPGGHIADFPATARWDEYVQLKDEYDGSNRKTGKQIPSGQWGKMPYLMLGKVAEALALRKAFPADLSGIYTAEEMSQADSVEVISSTTALDAFGGQYNQPPQEDDWTKANKRLRAVLNNARKAVNINSGPAAAECLRDLMRSMFLKDSAKDCTPEELHALADLLTHEPKALIPDSLTPDDEIPPFIDGEAEEVKAE